MDIPSLFCHTTAFMPFTSKLENGWVTLISYVSLKIMCFNSFVLQYLHSLSFGQNTKIKKTCSLPFIHNPEDNTNINNHKIQLWQQNTE